MGKGTAFIKASVSLDLEQFRKSIAKTVSDVDEIIKRGLEAAGAVIKTEAKRRVPVRSGSLKGSLVYYVVQMTKGKQRLVVRPSARYKGVWKGKRVRPVNYAHLIEHGFKQRDGRRNRGTPFLRTAFNSKKNQALKIAQQVINREINRRLKKR